MSISIESLYKHHTFGDLSSINGVLTTIDFNEWIEYNVIKANSAYIKYGVPRYFDSIIDLLRYIKLIDLKWEGEVCLLKRCHINLGSGDLQLRFINTISDDETFFKHVSTMQFSFDEKANRIEIDTESLPLDYLFFIGVLHSLGIISKDGNMSHSVNDKFTTVIKDELLEKLIYHENKKRKISLEMLLLQQENQRKVGLLAEQFVVEFEKYRVSLKSGKINLLSDKYINAGYDIESFNSNRSLSYDRFIEVKSYVEEISFYISRNEIMEAKRLGDRYFIYLVDRNRISEQNYTPKIIQNPYNLIFSKNDLCDWIVIEDGRFYKKCR
jgi:hypothetical protein